MMTSNLSLITLASEINSEHENCNIAILDGLQHAIKAGELLLQAKELVNHGEWLPWLKSNVTFSERTAQNYMRVFQRKNEILEKSATVADLSYKAAINLLADPKISEFEKIKAATELTEQILKEVNQNNRDNGFTFNYDERIYEAVKLTNQVFEDANQYFDNEDLTLNECIYMAKSVHRLSNEWAEFKIYNQRKLGEALNVYQAVKEIRDSKLYRETHSTFEEYAAQKWGIENITEFMTTFEKWGNHEQY